MKYKTPRFNTDQINRDFIASLPDEFEIVEPGMTQVRWPMILTKEKLMELGSVPEIGCKAELRGAALLALAAIAPEEKKRQYVMCYRKECGPFANVVAKEYPLGMEADKWKVVGGPYDIDTCVAGEPPVEKRKRKMKVLVTLDFGTHKVGPIESECEVTE